MSEPVTAQTACTIDVAQVREVLLKLLQHDIYLRILYALTRKDRLSLRGLAKEVNLAPKNVKRYVEVLEKLGLVTVTWPSSRLMLIELAEDVRPVLKQLFC